MKKIMMVALVMLISASAFAKGSHPVKVMSKHNEVVYFKVDASMIGATIEVYNEKGELVYSETVTSKKQIVDFYEQPSGSYTILIVKDGQEEIIDYVKK